MLIKKNSIIQGNSLEILKHIPEKSVDLIFADPPYNLQLKDTLYRPDQSTVEAVTNDWDKFDNYQAYDKCAAAGMRLCTRHELESNLCKNTGCCYEILSTCRVMF